MGAYASLPHIVVLGGGFGGLESAFSLRAVLGTRARITLLTERDFFVYKPNSIYIPFGLAPERVKIPLDKPTRKRGIDLYIAKAHAVDPTSKSISTDLGSFSYDRLIIATGAHANPDLIPGLREHAFSMWTHREMYRLQRALRERISLAQTGTRTRLLFALPPEHRSTIPLYELVFMMDTYLRRYQVRDKFDLVFATGEDEYLQAIGAPMADRAIREFSRRDIEIYRGLLLQRVEPHTAIFDSHSTITFDMMVTFPNHAPAVEYESLPRDSRGFVHVDHRTWQVNGLEDVYAVGDAASYPLKMGYLAVSQADAAAEHIAAHLHGRTVQPAFPSAALVLIDALDQATFAQVPLHHIEGIEAPFPSAHRSGTSPLWRVGKKALGAHVPARFSAGKPVHTGLSWRGMNWGLRLLSGTLEQELV